MQVAQFLIKKIKNTNNYKEWIEYIEDRPFNDKRYYISNQKLKALGWNIEVDFISGITMLIQDTCQTHCISSDKALPINHK